MRAHFVVFIALIVIGVGCSKHFPNEPLPNQLPETFLSLVPDDSLRSTTSQQHLQWWGVDPDGFVKGYYISFDSLQWTYTTSNDSLMGLKLNIQDTTYRFFVTAVDDEGALDPTPASLRYPIHNTPPVVSFVSKSDVPDTTFTVATFQWFGSDIDGNETITNYLYVLDDTSKPWSSLSGDYNKVTLKKSDGLTEGRHTFYLRARDVSGSYSKTIRMPDTTNPVTPTATWYVKEPQGDFLIVDDYGPADGVSDKPTAFYQQMFDTLMGGKFQARDVWDIKAGYNATTRGKYVPALINPTFSETIKLFKYIFWYSDNDPQMAILQAAIPEFQRAGGKIMFSTGFTQYPADARGFGDFAPVENIEQSYFAPQLFAFDKDSLVAVDASYPKLTFNNTIFTSYSYPRGLLPKVSARILYQMGKTTRAANTVWIARDTIPIIMGVKDADQASFVMLAVLLHRFSGAPNNVPALLRRVFQGEFGVQP